jgi:hypothetical protein
MTYLDEQVEFGEDADRLLCPPALLAWHYQASMTSDSSMVVLATDRIAS